MVNRSRHPGAGVVEGESNNHRRGTHQLWWSRRANYTLRYTFITVCRDPLRWVTLK
jgi:hypothetical protein